LASLAVLTWSRYCKRCVLVEEKEAEFIGSSSLNSYMGFAWCLSIQSHHCCFMGCHVCCYFTVPLWQHSQVSPQVTIVNPSLFLSSLLLCTKLSRSKVVFGLSSEKSQICPAWRFQSRQLLKLHAPFDNR
jgi:hypothetical protein